MAWYEEGITTCHVTNTNLPYWVVRLNRIEYTQILELYDISRISRSQCSVETVDAFKECRRVAWRETVRMPKTDQECWSEHISSLKNAELFGFLMVCLWSRLGIQNSGLIYNYWKRKSGLTSVLRWLKCIPDWYAPQPFLVQRKFVLLNCRTENRYYWHQ